MSREIGLATEMSPMRDGDPQRSALLTRTIKVAQPLALVAALVIGAAALFAWVSRPTPRHAVLVHPIGPPTSADRFVPSAAEWSNLTLTPVEEIAFRTPLSANAVPTPAVRSTAIIDDEKASHVWVATGDGALVRRPIVTGAAQGGMVEVVSGLSAGERALATGALLVERAASSNGRFR
jgi:hypothetical protein